MVISAVVAGLDLSPDRAEVRLTGELRLGSVPEVRRVLGKLLASHRELLVDLSDIRLTWGPAAQVFGAALAGAGGWPVAHIVLFGADPRMAAELHSQRITRTVPLATDRAAARERLRTRPDAVTRHLRLPPEVGAPRTAREFTADTCRDWAVHDAAGALLVVTELVTNAVEHTGASCEVGLRLDRHGLWIEVHDQQPGPPPRPRPRPVGSTDRGLGLHAVASIALHLDSIPRADGKTVWALLAVPAPGFRVAAPGDGWDDDSDPSSPP